MTTLAGSDRYQSAGNVNEKAFPNGVSEVVLADGLPGHQGDALAAAGYAGVNGYGILLTDNTNSVPANTLTALTTLKVKTIQPVGGPAAISAAELAQLTAAGYTVAPSLAGANSLGTMEAIDDTITPSSVGTSGTPALKTAILASVDENHLVDALSASGMSYGKKFPVITTESSASTLAAQAQQVITTLGIQKLIIVGGTASIPATQYTPDPTGVTSEDTSATTGADRSATSELLEKDEVANYGASNSSLAIAAGATYVGSGPAIQNDGADALASAPFTGGFMPTCVTDGPTNAGSVAQCGTDLASTLTSIYALTGTANLPTSQVTAVLTAAGGSSSSTANTYTVTGGSLTAAASTSSASSQGAQTYTVSGLPTASGTTANIALFPCTGTSQTGNGPTDGAPQTPSGGGATTFTAPGNTTPVAGSAVGQGTSSSNATASNGAGYSTGSVAGYTATAYVASVNGVPTSAGGTNTDAGPTQVYGVTVNGGSLTFVVNSFKLDCVVPVVYTTPSTAGSNPPLLVNANGTPQTGYGVGVGSPTFWAAPPAPSTSSGTPYVVSVALAPPLSGTSSFDGAVISGPAGTAGNVYNFNFGTTGSTYAYTDATPLSETSFASYLSGADAGEYEPNSNVLYDPTNNAGAGGVMGDGIEIGNTLGYAGGAPSNFNFDSAVGGDVPGAATGVTATYNGCAYVVSSVCTAGVVLTWTPPVNPDVSGSEAVAGGTTTLGDNASYQIWRSVDTSGTLAAAQEVSTGPVTVVPAGSTVNNGDGQTAAGCDTSTSACTSETSPEFIDTTAAAGTEYVYYLVAVAAPASGDQDGVFSTGTSPVTVGSTTVSLPTIESVTIVPGVASGGTLGGGGYGFTSGDGEAEVTYNEPVTCLNSAGADFTYSNGTTGGSPQPISGVSCSQGTTGTTYNQTTPITGGNGADTLIIGFNPETANTSVSPTQYFPNTVEQPKSGDFFTYTAPGTPTTANAVYAGGPTSPTYAATQTEVDNANPTADTNTGTAQSPSNPLS